MPLKLHSSLTQLTRYFIIIKYILKNYWPTNQLYFLQGTHLLQASAYKWPNEKHTFANNSTWNSSFSSTHLTHNIHLAQRRASNILQKVLGALEKCTAHTCTHTHTCSFFVVWTISVLLVMQMHFSQSRCKAMQYDFLHYIYVYV